MNMLTKTLLLAGGLFAAALIATNARASTLQEIEAATFKLHTGNDGMCSAVAVSPTQWVTAAHCVDGNTKDLNFRKTVLNDKFEVEQEIVQYVNVIRTIKAKDVAFVEARGGKNAIDMKGVGVATEEEASKLVLGDPLTVVGYPKAMELTITTGMYGGLVKAPIDELDSPFIKTTVPVTGGNSGGGLYAYFCDNGKPAGTCEYKLIGLTTASFRDVSFMSYFSTTKSLNAVISNLLSGDAKKTVPGEAKAAVKSDDGKTDSK